jgi:hypothetical protein
VRTSFLPPLLLFLASTLLLYWQGLEIGCGGADGGEDRTQRREWSAMAWRRTRDGGVDPRRRLTQPTPAYSSHGHALPMRGTKRQRRRPRSLLPLLIPFAASLLRRLREEERSRCGSREEEEGGADRGRRKDAAGWTPLEKRRSGDWGGEETRGLGAP